MSSSYSPKPANSSISCNSDVLDLPVPGEEIDYDGDLTPIIRQWTEAYAATEDVHDAERFEREVPADRQVHTRGIEVGQSLLRYQIFGLDEGDGCRRRRRRGGRSWRLLRRGGVAAGGRDHRGLPDDAGIKWPEAVAPFAVAILNLKQGAGDTDAACEQLYRGLTAKGVDVLYDDTDTRAGAKFATADLIGIPWQVMVGPKGLAEGKVEIKRRSDGTRELVSPADALTRLTA